MHAILYFSLTSSLYVRKTLKKEGHAFRNIGKKHIYIPDCKINLASFVSITMQRTSKWQTHLLHLHLETFKSHNSFSENYKNSNKKTAHRRYILGNRVSQVCASFESCGKSLVGPTGPMNVTISRQKNFITNSVLITLLKFACNTYLRPKMIGCMIKKGQFPC